MRSYMVSTKNQKSKKQVVEISGPDQVLKKLSLSRGMSVNRAIVSTSEFIDAQPNPEKFANAIIHTLQLPINYVSEMNQAKTLALAAVEKLILTDGFDPDATAEYAVNKLNVIMKKMPYAFSSTAVVSKKRRGAKRDVARQIYTENKGMDEKEIIKLVAKELDISIQNAYTYIYLIKKSIKLI